MAQVNYIRECGLFMEYAIAHSLSPNEHLLWRAIFHVMNRLAKGSDWPDGPINISNKTLLSFFPASKDSLIKARRSLAKRGLIHYRQGQRNKLTPQYTLIYLSTQQRYPLSADNMQGNPKGNQQGISQANPSGNIHYLPGKPYGTVYGNPSDTAHTVCRDDAWRTSARVRSAVAQRILDQWPGERTPGADPHFDIVCYLEKGMEPEQIVRVLVDCKRADNIAYHLHTEALHLGLNQEYDAPLGY